MLNSSLPSILILGHSGFIGSHITKALADCCTHNVVKLNLRVGPNMSSSLIANHLQHLEPPHFVLNLIGSGLSRITADEELMHITNSLFPVLLAEAIQLCRWDSTLLVHIGSSLEATDPRYESLYARTKAVGSERLYDLRKRTGQKIQLLWISNTYGPNQPSGRLVSHAIAAARAEKSFPLRFPHRIRSFCFIGDVVAVLMAAVSKNSSIRDAFIVGPGETSLTEVRNLIYQLITGKDYVWTHPDESLGPSDPYSQAPSHNNLFYPNIDVIRCNTSLFEGIKWQLNTK